MTRILIVNDNDEIIGSKERNDKNQTDIIRVSGLIVINTQKQILIAQRSKNKVNDPRKWGPSVAGTVEEGETYVTNIIKEAKEEIGLDMAENELELVRHSFNDTNHKYFSTVFSVQKDLLITDFVLQKDEVEDVKWISISDLIKWHDESPEDFIPSFYKTIVTMKDWESRN